MEMLHPLGGQSHIEVYLTWIVELALAAANRSNGHMAAETVAIFRLVTTVASSSCFRPELCAKKQPEIGPDWPPKGRDLVSHFIYISLKFLLTSPQETPIVQYNSY